MNRTWLLLACLTVPALSAGLRESAWGHTAVPLVAEGKQTSDPLVALPAVTGTTLTDMAIAAWTHRSTAVPTDETAWVSLGNALMQKARETENSTFSGHAERMYKKALALNPRNVDALTGMAGVCGERHDFAQSIAWANRAIAIDPRKSLAYGLLGDAAVETGDYDKAFEHYQTMLDIRPDLSSYSRGAHLLFLTGDTRKAILLMDKAIRSGGPFEENTAWCRVRLARMYLSTGALLPADQQLSAVLELLPGHYDALTAMGSLKAARKDYKAAIEHYRKAVAIRPEIESLAVLGDLYGLTRDVAAANAQYARIEAIHQRSKENGVSDDLSMARFYADHDRKLPEALQMARAEHKVRPTVYAADTLAWCLYKNGRYQEAKEAIREALRMQTPEASFFFHAGMIDAKLDDKVGARKNLHQAQSLQPGFHPIHSEVAAKTLGQLAGQPPSKLVDVK